MNSNLQIIERGYSRGMRAMHWITAALMVFVIVAGVLIGNKVKLDFYPKLYDHHRAVGFLLLFMVIIRLIVRHFATKPSPLPDTVANWQKQASSIVHLLLYFTLFLQPLLGWYATNAWGVKNIPFFFGLHLPQIVEKDRELGIFLLKMHHNLAMFIALLLVMHISAALYHHFILKDRVLIRMLKT